MSRLLGIISDTHGLLRGEALEALRGSDLILHAGDIGDVTILDQLRGIAPVFAVRGNTDREPWAKHLPLRETVEANGALIYLLHDLHDIDLDPKFAEIDMVVTGHTHRPHEYWKEDVLYLNPGSAGPRRFDLPVTLARLDLSQKPWRPQLIPLSAR